MCSFICTLTWMCPSTILDMPYSQKEQYWPQNRDAVEVIQNWFALQFVRPSSFEMFTLFLKCLYYINTTLNAISIVFLYLIHFTHEKGGIHVAALKLYFALLFTVNLIWPCTGLCEWLKESSKLLDVFNELLSCVSDIIVWNMKMKLCMFNEGQIKCDRTELYHLCYSSCLKTKRWEYHDFL